MSTGSVAEKLPGWPPPAAVCLYQVHIRTTGGVSCSIRVAAAVDGIIHAEFTNRDSRPFRLIDGELACQRFSRDTVKYTRIFVNTEAPLPRPLRSLPVLPFTSRANIHTVYERAH